MKNLEARRSKRMTTSTTARATVVGSDSPDTGPRERLVEDTRELAQRRSGTLEILLLWHPQVGEVELAVHDLATDASFHLEVAPVDAIDAFYHPYAYAARSRRTGWQDGARARIGE